MKFDINRQALANVVNNAVEQKARTVQALFDALAPACKGRGLEEVKAMLGAGWARDTGGSITDPELSKYAKLLAAGRPIKVRQETKTASDFRI